MWIMFEFHFEKRHFQSQKFGVVKVSEFSTAATVPLQKGRKPRDLSKIQQVDESDTLYQ
jgi:hypothetical protein